MTEEGSGYITGVSHIGIAVPDIAAARKLYGQLGFVSEMEETLGEENYGVRVLMMHHGPQRIELLEPLEKGKESPIDSYIEKKPYKMYHLAYSVSDLDAQVKILEKQKFLMIDEPRASACVEGKRAVFLFNRNMGIIELVEE